MATLYSVSSVLTCLFSAAEQGVRVSGVVVVEDVVVALLVIVVVAEEDVLVLALHPEMVSLSH